MPKCPVCKKEVYFAEKITSFGLEFHRPCFVCSICKKRLTPGRGRMISGKLYCYSHAAELTGPEGYGIQVKWTN